jgi:hypothetical protein
MTLRTVVIACLRQAGEVRCNLILGSVLSNKIASIDEKSIEAMTENKNVNGSMTTQQN